MLERAAVPVGSCQPVVTEHHGRQIEARFRGVDDARQSGKGQVTAQNAMGTATGERGEQLACPGHG